MTEFKSIAELEINLRKSDYRKDRLTEYDIIKAELTQTQAIIKLIEAQALLPFEKVFAERLIKILKGET